MDLIKEIHQFLKEEIDEMNSLILRSLSVEEELVKAIGSHIAESGGKRIRPVLTLLSAKMFDCYEESRIKLAASVEFIHMATLLHDDVVDESKMRRFLPSANVIWGNKASILVGDFLFSQSFKLMVATKSIDALVSLSNASALIAEGEVAQLAKLRERKLISEKEYIRIIDAKTATLFGAACEVGAIAASQSFVHRSALRNFGFTLGTIFQITDDLLDYLSESDVTGKNVGDDFFEGKVTLPIILLANKISVDKKNKLVQLIESAERTTEDFSWVAQLIKEYNIKEDIYNYLQSFKISAHQSLLTINIENKCREYLESLIDFAVNRSY